MKAQTQPIAAQSPALPEEPITFEEFLSRTDGNFAEWVGGKVNSMSPVSYPHQNISDFLAALLRWYVEAHDSGSVVTAPFVMRMHTVDRGREPDIMFVRSENTERIQHTYLDGPADLVIEITSPESALRDRGEKYAEYETEGVREYWIVDPDSQRADFYVLGDDSRYERVRPGADAVYRSAILEGLWLNVGWLWQKPLPPLRQVVKEWENEASARKRS